MSKKAREAYSGTSLQATESSRHGTCVTFVSLFPYMHGVHQGAVRIMCFSIKNGVLSLAYSVLASDELEDPEQWCIRVSKERTTRLPFGALSPGGCVHLGLQDAVWTSVKWVLASRGHSRCSRFPGGKASAL